MTYKTKIIYEYTHALLIIIKLFMAYKTTKP